MRIFRIPALEPRDLVAAPDGDLWVDSGQTFGVVNTSGQQVATYTVDGTPNQTALGPDGNIWFTESVEIGRITPTGSFTRWTVPSATFLGDIAAAPC
jgi:streptogramin lyase